MLVLFNDHMEDHSSGCTFGGCASYAMALQINWHSDLFDAGLGLYTSNEWPRPLYDNFPDTGSCTNYHWVLNANRYMYFAVCGPGGAGITITDPTCALGLFTDLDQRSLNHPEMIDLGSLAAVCHPFDSYPSPGPCYGQCFTGSGYTKNYPSTEIWNGNVNNFGLFYWPTTDGYTLAGPESSDGYFRNEIGSPNCR